MGSASAQTKYAAGVIYRKALRHGDIVRADECSRCGIEGKIHGHHPDYNEPLEVVWLCRKCHASVNCIHPTAEVGRGRAMYCQDGLWRDAKRHASKLGFVSVSDWIRGLMIEAMKEGK